jgi:hypothetical protein
MCQATERSVFAVLSLPQLDAAWIYWSDDEGILRTAKHSGQTTRLVSERGISSLAVDDCFVYWTNILQGAIRRVSKEGGDPQLVGASREPRAIKVDDSSIYWVSAGEVFRLETGAPQPKALTSTGGLVQSFAVDAKTLYFTFGDFAAGNSRVAHMPKDGGPTTVIQLPASRAYHLTAVTETSLYLRNQVGLTYIKSDVIAKPVAAQSARFVGATALPTSDQDFDYLLPAPPSGVTIVVPRTGCAQRFEFPHHPFAQSVVGGGYIWTVKNQTVTKTTAPGRPWPSVPATCNR